MNTPKHVFSDFFPLGCGSHFFSSLCYLEFFAFYKIMMYFYYLKNVLHEERKDTV